MGQITINVQNVTKTITWRVLPVLPLVLLGNIRILAHKHVILVMVAMNVLEIRPLALPVQDLPIYRISNV